VTLEECTELLTPYAIAMRVQMDVPTFKAYAMVLNDVPAHLAAAGLEALVKAGARFMPSAPEVRTAAEKARRHELALQQWDGCADCEDQKGWREVTDGRGVKRLERCQCVSRHRALMHERGLLEAIAPLPGEVARESEQVYPTLEQIPEKVRAQLSAVAGQKVLR
jgi:hypothetical protein